jgi:hypothetical protein
MLASCNVIRACFKRTQLSLILRSVVVATALTTVSLTSVRAAEPASKRHPGHYAALNESDEIRDLRHLDEPALRGVSKRYYWADLEPQKDAYNLEAVRRDLQFLKARDKQLVVFITDKTFRPGRNPLPGYLADYALPNSRGFTAMRWDPVVIGRFVALNRALARAFDEDLHFEGVAFQESGLMIGPEQRSKHNYTPEKYRAALIQILTESSRAFSRSQVFWYMNHLEGNDQYLGDVAKAVISSRVVMGGPDILPYRRRLQATYQLYETFKGRLPLFCSAQDDSYRHDRNDSRNMGNAAVTRNLPPPTEGYVPLDQIFLFARDRLHVSYVFWSCTYHAGAGSFNYDDAVAVMRKYPRW